MRLVRTASGRPFLCPTGQDCSEQVQRTPVTPQGALPFAIGDALWPTQEFIRRIGKALRTENNDFTRARLPERSVDLIRHLDERTERSRKFDKIEPHAQRPPPKLNRPATVT